MKKFAIEEHICRPEWMKLRFTEPRGINQPFPLQPGALEHIMPQICDEGEGRLESLDRCGIERCVLMNGSVGFDFIDDEKKAIEKCREYNDFLLKEICPAHPDRYQAFVTVPFVNVQDAVSELKRCMESEYCVGVMLGGTPRPGRYIDEEEFEPFWQAVEETGAFVYIHPVETPLDALTLYRGYKVLNGSTWSWGVDIATYVLRMIFSGLFDRHPKARLIMGHLAEMIPYVTVRIDNRWTISPMDSKNNRKPSDYFRTNIWLTVSGNPSGPALRCAIDAVGSDRIMFAVDYPFEPNELFAEFIDTVEISEEDREKICWKNAEELFLK